MTEKAILAGCWTSWFKLVGGGFRQIRNLIKRREMTTSYLKGDEVVDATLPGKVAKR